MVERSPKLLASEEKATTTTETLIVSPWPFQLSFPETTTVSPSASSRKGGGCAEGVRGPKVLISITTAVVFGVSGTLAWTGQATRGV